jgi:UDP-N-acetylmuramoyl-L-alanyl-D-glutamate--2,6-diaminopimelate ligase
MTTPSTIRLADMLAALPDATIDGATDVAISGVAYDSRRVQPGGLFVAIRGQHADGHRFIGQALERGAAAIVYDDPAARTGYDSQATFVRVPNSRAALSPIAAAWYGWPGRALRVIGVTGSKGKTTTSTLIAHVLDQDGHRSGLMTTVDFKIGPRWIENTTRQTTPEALEIQQMLREMADDGCDFAVVEASSHGLSPQWNRVGDCNFDVAVITNITHEHLDYHGTFEQYRADKARLFALLSASASGGAAPASGADAPPCPTGGEGSIFPSPPVGEGQPPQRQGEGPKVPKTAVVNLDDPNAQYFIDAAGDAQIITVAINNPLAAVRPRDLELTRDGVRFVAVSPWGEVPVELGIPGEFNVLNALAAVAVGLAEGISVDGIAAGLRGVRGVNGRMERVELGQPWTVVVDYAHNPDSFERVMGMMRPLTQGQLISVFGSAGERDQAKRAIQGSISGRFCDLSILSDEDPRDEDPVTILREIAAGVEQAGKREGTGYLIIPDRRAAVREAFRRARPGDVVLLLGKGHESCILYERGRTLPWNERAEAEAALRAMGYGDSSHRE